MNDIKKTEEILAKFTRKSPPWDLRTRVMEAAAKKRDRMRLLSPSLLKAALIAAVAAIVFMIFDAGMEESQKKRIASFFDHSEKVTHEWDDQSFIIREVVAGDSSASWAMFRLNIGKRAKEKEARKAKQKLLRREINEDEN
jgi:hypothetical protein